MLTLSPGDIVSVIAPASQFRRGDRHLLERGVGLLESWGLQVRVRVDDTHFFYLAGSDPVRAGHLLDALEDEQTRAIFCTRGGYGSARLLHALTRCAEPVPKLLVGHSDITALHLGCARAWPQIHCIHGPNIATEQLLKDDADGEKNRRSLRAALLDGDYTIESSIRSLRPGVARAPVVGGCLSLVVSCLGTPHALMAAGRILFLEDTGEAPYKIDRMLTHARLAGLFDGVEGIVFGVMRSCTDPYNDLDAVIADVLAGIEVPIGIGLPSGHGPTNLSLRLGATALLDTDAGVFRL